MTPSKDEEHVRSMPAVTPSTADTTHEEAEAEMAALCAAYEAQQRLDGDGECLAGCDSPDGPLSPTGCPW